KPLAKHTPPKSPHKPSNGPISPRVAGAFNNDYYQPAAKDPKLRGDRNLHVGYIEVEGPTNGVAAKLPESHMRIITARPKDGESPRRAADKVLRAFASRAFRRAVKDEEVAPLVDLVEIVMQQGDTYEHAIEIGVQAILVSPHFVFRVESDKKPDDPAARHEINDYEWASRLSYFLWSSTPDDTLLDIASRGELNNPTTLRAQVTRMLADPKSKSLVDQFAVQWLNLRNLDEVSPDPTVFNTWNAALKSDMRRETLMLFQTVMQDDLSVLSFLNADFTFLNERLAKHYEIGGVKGDEFRKVSLDTKRRSGVLTHASILAITSDPTRTSPVKRGKWILENILGTPPPPPPPNIPELEKVKSANPGASMRKQMEIHQTNPGCASCHKLLDPLGFGLENFDAIGRWRDKDGKHTVDASGVMPSGEKFNGPVEMVRILMKRQDDFCSYLTDRMMTFSLGRGLEFYDKCAVDKIVEQLKRDDYRFSTLVTEIVLSTPFRMRRGDGGNPDE
ncbi:MAG: DUF1592 domain-containing protein, partial [Planctomycetota bacterium]|nr:DUF1592 domain-containing protein [Planctomycetota bacterium]